MDKKLAFALVWFLDFFLRFLKNLQNETFLIEFQTQWSATCLFQAAAGVGGLVTIMAACFYYIQVFAEGAPTAIFWVLSLLSQPAFAMAIDKVSTVMHL